MDNIQAAVDQLYKTHFGKMVASLLSFSSDIGLAEAEDLVQEAFSTALVEWRAPGIPSNPSGWIYTVCKNRALNRIKKTKTTTSVSSIPDVNCEDSISESPVEDQQLNLLFICAHPDLPPKSQVVVTLKYVINLKVEAIAKLLGMTVDGIDKILIRARQKIRSENLIRETSDPTILKSRLPIVHKIIYLIFNEGYRSSWGKQLIREELCEEALILNKALLDSDLANKETAALQALMLFNCARLRARFNAEGDIVELENQDRSLWNKNLITLAEEFLDRAKDEVVSTYHIEASIAYLHCSADRFETTNWQLIVKLYRQLLHDNPNPFVEMNYAIALFYAGEHNKAFQLLNGLQRHPFLNQYFLLNATLGKLHLLSGNNKVAKQFLLSAIAQTNFETEKKLIQKMTDTL